MSKHTPGPWKVLREHDWHTGTKFGIVGVVPSNHTITEANASLIAAAPDLLEALEWAMDRVGYHQRTGTNGSYCDQVDKARAAIAKAKGES
ncbi:hypothetical protein D3C76_260090 [compost metagenome]